jgi:CrcB protein
MIMYLVVGIGGIIGALLRFSISEWFLTLGYISVAGTLCVNLIGCFMLGLVQGCARVFELPPWLVTGVGTGLIGAFTTFSTFSIEVVRFLEQGNFMLALYYIVISSVGGYFLANMGFSLVTYKKNEV